MNTDFSKIDKSKFKCLQHDDGSVYYGQLVHCWSALEPKPDKLDGFELPVPGYESIHGGRIIAKDLSLISDELKHKL